MRVAIFTPVFWPYHGGIGRVAENNSRGLVNYRWETDIFTPRFIDSLSEKENQNGINIIRLKPRLKFGNAAWIGEDMDLSSYDILHLHYPFIGGVKNVLKLKLKYRKPLVVTYHMDLVDKGWRGCLFKIYSWITIPKIIKAADKIIFSTYDYGRNSFLAKYLKEQPEKFAEIPFGVSSPKNVLNKNVARQQLYIDEAKKIILFVGALDQAHYFKGLDVLFTAIKNILPTRQDFKIVIVGGGELKNVYEKKARKMNIDDKFIFVGKVSDEELNKYYYAADVLILPSVTASEAYGMVLVEAAICGLPAIASNLPGVREQIDQERGRLFAVKNSNDLAKQILEILGDDKLIEKMSKKAEEWAKENRSLEKETEGLLTVYKLVAAV